MASKTREPQCVYVLDHGGHLLSIVVRTVLWMWAAFMVFMFVTRLMLGLSADQVTDLLTFQW
jgi:hypothetical protein